MKTACVLGTAKSLKLRLTELPAEYFECLTFGELKAGEMFIGFPWPGDNVGHGGFKDGYWLFIKVVKKSGMPSRPRDRFMAVRLVDGVLLEMEDSCQIIKVL
jgi:hypothetical protein